MTGDRGDFLKRVLLAYGLSVVLLMLTNVSGIMAMRFPDPDDVLRLVQVRSLLDGQGWYDMVLHRVDPAHGGVLMHWTRWVDMPLAGTILLFRPLLGAGGAEMAALLIVPMVTLLVVQLLVARIAWERLGAEAATLSCLMLVMSVPVINQIRPMRIDHHGWQIATAMLAVQGLMTRHARAGGWLSGAALAVGMSISLESLPLVTVFGALGAWRWLRGGETRLWLVHFAQSLAVISLLSFAAMRGMVDLVNHCDAISPVHLAVFVWGALALGGLSILRGARMGMLIAGLAVVGAVGLALYLGLAPQCRAGSFGMLDPLVRTQWYDRIDEGLPVWKQLPEAVLQNTLPPLFALLACVRLIRSTTGDERIWWQEYVLVLGGALAISMLVIRAGAVTGALCAVPLAWQFSRWLGDLREARGIGRRVGTLVLILLATVPAAPLLLRTYVSARLPQSGEASGQGQVIAERRRPVLPPPWIDQTASCRVAQSKAVFGPLPRGTILTPFDVAPALMMATDDSVLATGHHRGARPMHDTILAFLSKPERARAIAQANGIDYVALCPAAIEAQTYAYEAPQGLAARLMAGHVPDWLTPVSTPPGDLLHVWKVTRP